jgi:hypothetical protein
MNDKNYDDQIRYELTGKLKEYILSIYKMEKIEKETGEDFDILIDTNANYQRLSDKCSSSKFDIDRILIDLKGYPLTIQQNEGLISILADTLQENIDEDAIYKRIVLELNLNKDNLIERLKSVKILFLSSFLHERVFNLYREAVDCYIRGNFNATCVLCRAISELIAKRYIEHRGQGNLLCGKEGEQKTLTIPAILRTKLSCPTLIIEKYRKIHSKADHILHDIDEKTIQDEALGILKLLREFIMEFPKCT